MSVMQPNEVSMPAFTWDDLPQEHLHRTPQWADENVSLEPPTTPHGLMVKELFEVRTHNQSLRNVIQRSEKHEREVLMTVVRSFRKKARQR